MEQVSQITEFGKIFLYLVMGVLFVLFTFFMASLVALKKPNPEKLMSYECGEEPTGNSWIQFNSRFYVIALVFLLFDVEMVFIFPWTTIFSHKEILAIDNRWGWLSLIEMFVFVGILLLGLVYVWKKGDLNWYKQNLSVPKVSTKIPTLLYQNINKELYQVKQFSIPDALITTVQTESIPLSTNSKPMFKPTFRKS